MIGFDLGRNCSFIVRELGIGLFWSLTGFGHADFDCGMVGWTKSIGVGEGPERARSHCRGALAARRVSEASGIRSKRCYLNLLLIMCIVDFAFDVLNFYG